MSHMKNRDSNKPRRQQHQAEAQVRKDLAAQKTYGERLQKLDDTLGKAFGALRERTKYAQPPTPPVTAAPEASSAPQAPAKAPKKAKTRKKALKPA